MDFNPANSAEASLCDRVACPKVWSIPKGLYLVWFAQRPRRGSREAMDFNPALSAERPVWDIISKNE